MGKPTVHDIAREAGVSLATVDRVLNARAGVRDKTVQRVQAAVQKLGYVRDTYAANLARQREYRFAFVLPEGPSQFVDTLRTALREAAAAQLAERISVRVVPVPVQDPHAAARVLHGLTAQPLDGVAIMAPETPQVRDAIVRLRAGGVAVVALASDLPNSERDHFVGINSVQAGRTAGVLMGRFVGRGPGEVLVVTQSLQAWDSIERRLGFDAVMAAQFPHLRVLPTLEGYGDPRRVDEVVGAAVAAHPALVGVYSMGAGTTPLLVALRRTRRLAALTVVAHELTPATRAGLEAGEVDAVITQNVGHLVRSALRVLRARSDGVAIFEAQERIRIEIVIRENLP